MTGFSLQQKLYLGHIGGGAFNEDILCLKSDFWMIPWKTKDRRVHYSLHKIKINNTEIQNQALLPLIMGGIERTTPLLS